MNSGCAAFQNNPDAVRYDDSTCIAILSDSSTALKSTSIILILTFGVLGAHAPCRELSRVLRRSIEVMKSFIQGLRAAGLLFALTTVAAADEPLKIATSAGPVGQLVSFAAKLAKDKGIDVKVVELSDWVALNEVVNSGDVDANLFQHATYLAIQNKQRGFNLVQVDNVGVIAPVGLFSKKIKKLDEIKSGDSVAIPNEPLNGARGLILLERAGLIKLTPGKGFSVSKFDIIENPKNLKIVELDPAQTYRSLDDVTLALVNITYLIPAGGDPKSALLIDQTVDDGLVLRFTARLDKKDDPRLKAFIEVFKSPQVKQFIEEKIPAFIPAGFNS
jgi:D-methionine transport system substrate-binding protein